MTLKIRAAQEIPEETVRVARLAFPNGSQIMGLRDELGTIYTEEEFKDLFPAKGQPAESPAILALIIVLQFAEGLTDRQVADAVRGRIDWKYALGLELTDPRLDYSVESPLWHRRVSFRCRALGCVLAPVGGCCFSTLFPHNQLGLYSVCK